MKNKPAARWYMGAVCIGIALVLASPLFVFMASDTLLFAAAQPRSTHEGALEVNPNDIYMVTALHTYTETMDYQNGYDIQVTGEDDRNQLYQRILHYVKDLTDAGVMPREFLDCWLEMAGIYENEYVEANNSMEFIHSIYPTGVERIFCHQKTPSGFFTMTFIVEMKTNKAIDAVFALYGIPEMDVVVDKEARLNNYLTYLGILMLQDWEILADNNAENMLTMFSNKAQLYADYIYRQEDNVLHLVLAIRGSKAF